MSPEYLKIDPVSKWFKQDQIHQATHVHYQASFLAWHRFLVNEFEAQLQQIDPGLALHYWDWTTDPRRSPDGNGGFVNLMTILDFMGASNGLMGSPFAEANFYRPGKVGIPNRAVDANGKPRKFKTIIWEGTPRGGGAKQDFAEPPYEIRRALLKSGHTPLEITYDDDVKELWDDSPASAPKWWQTYLFCARPDRDIVGASGRPGIEFERFWRAVTKSHDVAHRYIGGTLRPRHTSFEDPFVFLLHSNVDRLWASWQLRSDGVAHDRETSFRLDPDYVYGHLIDGEAEGEFIDWRDKGSSEPVQDFLDKLDRIRQEEAAAAKTELASPLAPWEGQIKALEDVEAQHSIRPWNFHPHFVTPRSPEVLRPPLYDKYVTGRTEPIHGVSWVHLSSCMSWTSLRLGLELPRGDVIRLAVELEAVSATDVEFVLKAGPGVWWWKGLRLPDDQLLEIEGDMAIASALVPADQVRSGKQLIFHKMIAAAGWRIVYRLDDRGWISGGSRLTFYWDKD